LPEFNHFLQAMKQIRLGIIGAGSMGAAHAQNILDGKVRRVELAGLCSLDASRLAPFAGKTLTCTQSRELIGSGRVDAVLIATPHTSHPALGIDALQAGLHVLVEKPIAIHKAEAARFLAAHTNPKQVFAVMFNQRTDPFYRRIRAMVHGGELGEVRRVNWTITNWFRTEAYYASGGWRATWAGEGGGVLLNQSPHNLDLFQWIFGMPARVRAFCALGRYHDIEVEDDVTAYLEFPNGTTAVFITSTGEAPGTNRLEIAAERGRLVCEDDTLTFLRNEVATSEFSRTCPTRFDVPPRTEIKIPVAGHGGQHVEILQNFVDAILDGVPLIAPAAEAIHSVELANAMLYSSLTKQTVELPLDAAAYEQTLKGLVANSSTAKQEVRHPGVVDFGKSFNR
jgi:predicted dehydrogenase